MLIDKITLLPGSEIINARIEFGLALPINPLAGRLFFLTEAINSQISAGLYVYDGTAWRNGDISEIVAGSGISGGGTSGVITVSVDTGTVAMLNSPTFTGTVSLPSTTSIGNVSNLELGYLDGVSSGIQSQLNGKLNLSGGTMTGNIVMSADKVVSVPTPTGGFTSQQAVNKAYVDSVASGVIWINPVRDPNLISDTLNTPPVTTTSESYIIGSSPTGAWFGLSGHAVYWNGTGWTDLLSRPVQIGDRFGVAIQFGTVSGGLTGSTSKIATIITATPGSIAYDFTDPVQSYSVFVNDSDSLKFGFSFTYVDGSWVEFSGPSSVASGVGLSFTGNTLNINLGAGIVELPSDEVGIDIYSNSGLMTTLDGTASSTATAAKLSLTKTGTAGTYASITTDDYGRVISGTTSTVLSSGTISSNSISFVTTTADQVLDSFSSSTYRSAKYQVQLSHSSGYQTVDIQILHDGTISYLSEFGVIFTGSSLATFNTDISSGNVRLLVSPISANTTIKFIVSYINV